MTFDPKKVLGGPRGLPLGEVGLSVKLQGVVYGDTLRSWILLLPNEQQTALTEYLSFTPEEWEDFIHQTDTVNVLALVQDPQNKKLGRAFVRKCERQVAQDTSWSVFRRDGYRCRYCGNDSVPLTVDHLVTWEEGGPSTGQNLLSSCKKCNNKRGNTTFAEWLSSPYYQKVSRGLTPEVVDDNLRLRDSLHQIVKARPHTAKKKSR